VDVVLSVQKVAVTIAIIRVKVNAMEVVTLHVPGIAEVIVWVAAKLHVKVAVKNHVQAVAINHPDK